MTAHVTSVFRRAVLGAFAVAGGIAGPLAAQQESTPLTADARQVLRAVMDTIAATNASAVTTIVGLPIACWPSEGTACAGKELSEAGRAQAQGSVEYVASLRASQVSTDAFATARGLVTPAVIDSSTPRSSWYRVCGSDENGQPLSRVAIVRPSVVRETKPGEEWRVIVTVHTYPTRGECTGYASAHDYVVEKDSGTGTYRVTRMEYIGGGSGRLPGGE